MLAAPAGSWPPLSGAAKAGSRNQSPGGVRIEVQSRTAAADQRHPGNMAHHVQQLQQAGFDDGRVRALASFISDMARETTRPFVESMGQRLDDMQLRADQRHAELNQRLGDMQQQLNQRLGDMQQQMDQRLGGMQQHMDRAETRLDRLERHTGRLGEGLARMDARVEGLQRRQWVILTMMGLGFISIVAAILLATRVIG